MAGRGQGIRTTEIDVLLAEERGAETRAALETIRSATKSADAQTARVAIRAIGRLAQPALIPDLLPALRYPLPETRAEAANAIGEAAQGWRIGLTAPRGTDPSAVLTLLATRLTEEEDANVRAALAETVGRLPYSTNDDVARAEHALVSLASSEAVPDRLGAAKGLDALIRSSSSPRDLTAETLAALRDLIGVPGRSPRSSADSVRDVRVRRLALEALTAAGVADADMIQHSSIDPDPQVRRLAMRAAALSPDGAGTLSAGLSDASALVRFEALSAIGSRGGDAACTSPLAALADNDVHVALLAIDQLGGCGSWPQAALVLEDVAKAEAVKWPRTWHRAAHAIVALARAAPDRAANALAAFTAAARGPARVYAARAAVTIGDRAALRALARDAVPAAAATAIEGLARAATREDEALFVQSLSAGAPQVVGAAALALSTAHDKAAAMPAMKTALSRLTASPDPGSAEAVAVLRTSLTRLGEVPPAVPKPSPPVAALSVERLRRLASPRARIHIKDVGTIELALFTTEAPATVLRFAELAESGYYDGLTFHRAIPNRLVQGGSPGADDRVGSPGPPFRDEVGTWPHVRGTLGMAAAARDEGRAQFFLNVVDNPRFDHERTVFGQVLNGIDIIDRILEGDVIERIEIMP
jgi:cyclophilin family peptidyl-prolyl cis-trans isomerase/HEAT repeat protein